MNQDTSLTALGLLDKSGMNALRTMLSVAQLKNQIGVANIANASTEGYAPRRLSFETMLTEYTHAYGSQGQSTAALTLENVHIQIPDAGKSVVIEEEIALLNLNQVQHQALLSMVNSQLELYNMAITDGRR